MQALKLTRLEAMSAGVEVELELEQVIVRPRDEALRPPGKDALLI